MAPESDHRREVQDLLDKEAIRAVISRYCRGVDRADVEFLRTVFHADAVDEHAGRRLEGPSVPDVILEWVRPFKATAHHITTQNIWLDRETAVSEAYYTAWLVEGTGEERVWHTVGRYIDSLRREQGEWRIAHRRVVMETARYLPPAEVPELALLGEARRDREDPSYTLVPPGA